MMQHALVVGEKPHQDIRDEPLSRADMRRTQVLDAAFKCFGRRGFHGASMADLAAEASMSVGQIYRYFANKEAIVAALVARDTEEAAQRTAAARAQSGDMIEELVELTKFRIERTTDPDRAALALEILAEAARNPRVGEIVRKADQAGRDRLRDVLMRCGGAVNLQCLETRMDMITMLLDGWAIRAVKNIDINKEAYLTALRPMFSTLLCDEDSVRCG